MAKISDEDLDVGREYIHRLDLDKFMAWCELYVPDMNLVEIKETYRRCFKVENTQIAIKLFNRTIADYDQATEDFNKKVQKVFGCGVFVISATIVIGAIGGVVYLVKAIF